MDNTMIIGLTRQITLRRAMDIAANNIANANTSGFKVERIMLEPNTTSDARHDDGPKHVSFVDEWAMGRDFTQGSLTKTNRTLDMALQGEGFFMLDTPAGERFTRDGQFSINEMGELVSSSGDRVLDDLGQPVQVDPQGGPIEISANGQISQDGLPGQVIGTVRFDKLGLLEKVGENQFRASDDVERLIEGLPTIHQGHVEQSNVRPILEITRMMEVSRAYASVSKMINNTDELARKAIERLGRA